MPFYIWIFDFVSIVFVFVCLSTICLCFRFGVCGFPRVNGSPGFLERYPGSRCRPELQARCESNGLRKTGTIADLRSRLVERWLSEATVKEIDDWAQKTNGAEKLQMEELPSSAATTQAAGSATGKKPAPKAPASGGSVLQNCQPLQASNQMDMSDMFSNALKGPQLPDATCKGAADIVEEGKDGILPLAAVVKVLQALDETPRLQQVALLLAGRMRVKISTTIHPLVAFPTNAQMT